MKQNIKAKPTQTAQVNKPKTINNHDSKLSQDDEELITVILPTISVNK